MSKEIYVALESWEGFNDNICEIADTIQEFSSKDYVTATLLQSFACLVEQRFTVWQKLQQFGFSDINQARAALVRFRENERREHSNIVNL